jgi:hypothetical protein
MRPGMGHTLRLWPWGEPWCWLPLATGASTLGAQTPGDEHGVNMSCLRAVMTVGVVVGVAWLLGVTSEFSDDSGSIEGSSVKAES